MSKLTQVACAAVMLLGASSFASGADRTANVERLELRFPGRVVDLLVGSAGSGSQGVLALVAEATGEASPSAPPGRPCGVDPADGFDRLSLWRFSLSHEEPVRQRQGLPGPTGRLLWMDVDGSGAETLLLLAPGRLVRVSLDGSALDPLVEHPDVHPRTSELVVGPDGPILAVPGLGDARFFAPVEGVWKMLTEVLVPIEAEQKQAEFRLDAPPPRHVPELEVPLWTTPPKAVGQQRVHGLRINPRSKPAAIEWWASLPQPEEPLDHAFLSIGGQAALLLTTRRADKLGVFGEKRLRLFRLEADRGRAGRPPFFAVETRINLWQSVVPLVLDVNGDGHEDLVLGYWKGLVGDRVVFDVYPGDGAGSFLPSPSTTGVDVKKGDREFLDLRHDVDGDGRRDLALLGKGRLQVFPGTKPGAKGQNLVASKPAWSVEIEDAPDGNGEIDLQVGRGGLRVAADSLGRGPFAFGDLDDDGRAEAVRLRRDGDSWVLIVLRFGER